MIQAVRPYLQLSGTDNSAIYLDPEKEKQLREFIEQVGGIENARQALEFLAHLQKTLS